MKTTSTFPRSSASDLNINALVEEVTKNFEKFCLATRIAHLRQMMSEDADRLAGKRYSHSPDKPERRQCHTRSWAGFHGVKVATVPGSASRLRARRCPSSWEEVSADCYLDQWLVNLMTAGAAMRKPRWAMWIPETGVPCGSGCGLSESAVSRRFKALTQAKFDEWMTSDLSDTALVTIQIGGLRVSDRLLMTGAVGIDAAGRKRPLAII